MKRFGFSLIELTVVMGISMLLVAVIFPAFTSARETSRRAICQSNLKQVIQAVNLYQADYDGIYPLAWPDSNGDNARNTLDFGWAYNIHTYLRNNSVLRCPSESFTKSSIPTAAGFTHFFFNSNLGDNGIDTVKDSEIQFPVSTVMLGDGDGSDGVSHYSVNGGLGTPANGMARNNAPTRHNGGANYAFCDGHVRWTVPNIISGWDVHPDGKNFTFCPK